MPSHSVAEAGELIKKREVKIDRNASDFLYLNGWWEEKFGRRLRMHTEYLTYLKDDEK